jgi:membrane associated rhomboid family serine protease
MYAYYSPLDDIKAFFRRSSLLATLIYVNLGVFLLVQIVNVFMWLLNVENPAILGFPVSVMSYYFSVPASIEALLSRPWTLFTYMFLHESFFHILFNMIVLYFGGRIFNEYLDNRKLLSVYILGGFAGALFYIAAFNFFPVFRESLQFSIALGASASVLAILIAVATYVPNYSVVLLLFGKVKLKHLAWVIILIDIISIPKGNAGGHIAHLGGAFWGFLYITLMKRGIDLTVNFHWLNFGGIYRHFTKKRVTYVEDETPYQGRPVSDEDYNLRKKEYQEHVDEILEKISKSGYSSLTKEEKALLFQSSNKNKN